ncbi:MAG: glutamine-hydrolyzing carbamoyl-phosphate synthase small subunit [Gammaproteobacteria bacterium]|nr:glutamine-hydrolyzing carbamoyl-phosphate synthase small subunit [Gammaproteobacteria bacterium]
MRTPAILMLEDGTLFWGESIGMTGEATGEVVFNTSMTGYQEILTDPSYCKQIVTLTYPHVGNTGANDDDEESSDIVASGLVIRDLPLLPSSWRSQQTLDEYLRTNNVVSICGIDTRKLTRILREKGALSGCIIAGENIDEVVALKYARDFSGLQGVDLAKVVSTKTAYSWGEGCWSFTENQYKTNENENFHVVAYDFGIKRNILRMLVERGCRVTVVPAQTSADDVLKYQPDGVFLSNGPGDPEPCSYAIQATEQLLEKNIPLFGICLGHQILALASGAKTVKMRQGHHGANHPVQDLESKRVMITSQNHGFAVDEASLPEHLYATHRSLFDQTLQGIHHKEKPAFGFQGHPEASPGPHDAAHLFDHFIELMRTTNA